MSRKAYRENYAEIEWKELPLESIQKTKGPSGPFFMADIQPFVSPLDFTTISSRSQLREHEKRHGVRQCGELKSHTDFAKETQRWPDTAFNEKNFDQAFRKAVEKTGL
jgi:hypothetical protein